MSGRQFLGSLSVLRWRAGDWRSLGLVALAALPGKAWDIRDRSVEAIPQYYAGNWHDIWNTPF